MNETTLAKKIKKRDERVFLSIIDQYTKLLWTIAANILGASAQDVEECVSDIFIALWNQPEKYDPQRGSLKTYLCIQARSHALNMRAKSKKTPIVYMEDYKEDLVHPADQELLLMQKESHGALYDAIQQLKEPTKEIIVRRYFFDERPREIAEKLSLDIKEVENRLYRGKKSLLELLKKEKEALLS